MKWLQWEEGRRSTGYYKMLIFRAYWFTTPFDLYLLKYPTGSSVPPHTDTVSGYRHYRINVVMKKASIGGDFKSDYCIVNLSRLKIFRSDFKHEVTLIEKGIRYVLSFGVCLKIKGEML
jgi:hypothetical protein